MKKVLIVDRNTDFIHKVKAYYKNEFQIFSAVDISSAMGRIFDTDMDLILISTNVIETNIFRFLLQITKLLPDVPVVVMVKEFETETSKKLKSFGATICIVEPEYPRTLKDTFALVYKNKELPQKSQEQRNYLNRMIGTSRAIVNIKQSMLNYSQGDAPVLLLGESGTGKDLAAQCIHNLSPRKQYRYTALNCSAIPHELIESELFGVEKGAFTGATAFPGKFELTNQGTIFLDEISEMQLGSQVKLLRILEGETVTRLGGQREIPIDCRLITATNKNLKKETAQGHFRMDLLYRINTLFMEIPPLRKRKEDIEILAEYFLHSSKKAEEHSFSINAVEKLCQYDWPGNIRELRNVIERSLYSCTGSIIRSSDIDFFS